MKLKQLNEFNYNGFGDDEFEDSHNENGKKKQNKKPITVEKQNSKEIEKLNKLLIKKQNELEALIKKINVSKNETQKYRMVNDRKNPLIATIQNLKLEIEKLS